LIAPLMLPAIIFYPLLMPSKTQETTHAS
jgi:hypothetical protein